MQSSTPYNINHKSTSELAALTQSSRNKFSRRRQDFLKLPQQVFWYPCITNNTEFLQQVFWYPYITNNYGEIPQVVWISVLLEYCGKQRESRNVVFCICTLWVRRCKKDFIKGNEKQKNKRSGSRPNQTMAFRRRRRTGTQKKRKCSLPHTWCGYGERSLHASLIQRSAGGPAIARSDQWSDNWYVGNTNLQVFFFLFFPVLWCSQSGDHPQKDLAKSG
jgi:hypothetical protein